MSQQDTIVEVPAGEVLIRMTATDAEALTEWTECAAVRLHQVSDEVYELQFARDLDLITDPEASGV